MIDIKPFNLTFPTPVYIYTNKKLYVYAYVMV